METAVVPRHRIKWRVESRFHRWRSERKGRQWGGNIYKKKERHYFVSQWGRGHFRLANEPRSRRKRSSLRINVNVESRFSIDQWRVPRSEFGRRAFIDGILARRRRGHAPRTVSLSLRTENWRNSAREMSMAVPCWLTKKNLKKKRFNLSFNSWDFDFFLRFFLTSVRFTRVNSERKKLVIFLHHFQWNYSVICTNFLRRIHGQDRWQKNEIRAENRRRDIE